jgi:hypothetical protein
MLFTRQALPSHAHCATLIYWLIPEIPVQAQKGTYHTGLPSESSSMLSICVVFEFNSHQLW